jgi:hypothetical protein
VLAKAQIALVKRLRAAPCFSHLRGRYFEIAAAVTPASPQRMVTAVYFEGSP